MVSDQQVARTRRRNKRRAKAIKYLGSVCATCGDTDRLEFDHIDPKTKEYKISDKLLNSFESLKPELDKCQLLCFTCHRSKSGQEYRLDDTLVDDIRGLLELQLKIETIVTITGVSRSVVRRIHLNIYPGQ